MEKIIGYCVIAAIGLIYLGVEYYRGNWSFGDLFRPLVAIAIVVIVPSVVLIPFFLMGIDGVGLGIISIFSTIISWWLAYKYLKC